jgi:hypothetical protein
MTARAAIVLLAALAMGGCATVDEYFGTPDGDVPGSTGAEFPEGGKVPAPWGYYDHCIREPDSVFCR